MSLLSPKLNDQLRFVLFTDGLLLLMLAAAMLLPMLVDGVAGNPDWATFGMSAAATAFAGGGLMLACSGHKPAMSQRTGYLFTVSAWLAVAAAGATPLYFSSAGLSYTDSFFEAMSALTTTGSTVIVGLDSYPPGLLLWRSLMQWLGGIGIVVMAIVLLPMLRIGGQQLFQSESSDISGKPVPRLLQMVERISIVYLALTTACTFGYMFAGMGLFDAVNHAMATLATGGFSTKDASIGYFNSVGVEVVGIVFMVAGALPLIWYTQIFRSGGGSLQQERQIPLFLGVLGGAILLMVAWNVLANHMNVWHALRISAFNVTSVLTDTGFATADFSSWGSFPIGVFFMLYLIGGCTGSTAGSIKIFRWQILGSGLVRQLRRMVMPHQMFQTRYGRYPVEEGTVHGVHAFFFMYLLTLFVLTVLVMATGLDFLTSISAVAQAMANAGPGLGPLVGPSTNFGNLPVAAKWLLDAAMLLGRLEIATVYVLFLGSFWRT
ncbi:MAG: potassium transporter TrkH [Alphaproteobacteria bacterium]|nr:potassium transporter TrkH [Alphaproteobacteria bacterium]